jgi:F-type H+-transporting ATPase subunit b
MAENTSAHTEVPGGHGGGFPPFNAGTYASQLVWLGLAFVLLYALMSKLALPRVAVIFDLRRARIADDLAEAGRLKGTADAASAAYQQALADAHVRAQTLAGETRDRLVAEADKARAKLEDRLNARLAEADKAITASKVAAMANVRGIAVEAAAAIVTRLIGVAAPERAVAKAVDDVLKR